MTRTLRANFTPPGGEPVRSPLELSGDTLTVVLRTAWGLTACGGRPEGMGQWR